MRDEGYATYSSSSMTAWAGWVRMCGQGAHATSCGPRPRALGRDTYKVKAGDVAVSRKATALDKVVLQHLQHLVHLAAGQGRRTAERKACREGALFSGRWTPALTLIVLLVFFWYSSIASLLA